MVFFSPALLNRLSYKFSYRFHFSVQTNTILFCTDAILPLSIHLLMDISRLVPLLDIVVRAVMITHVLISLYQDVEFLRYMWSGYTVWNF